MKMKTPADLESSVLLMQTAEKCAELAQTCLELARKIEGSNPTPKTMDELYGIVVEKLADVGLCITYLKDNLDINEDTVTILADHKNLRWIRRINDGTDK